jgi:DNA-binding NarL/FixJ family response regulator
MSSTHVAVISKDRLFCEGLKDMLRSESSLTVVPPDALPSPSVPEDGIQIAIVDARCGGSPKRLPITSGKAPYVIFVGAADDDAWASQALTEGARGVLTRAASREDLLKAIAVVRDGGIWARRRWLNACVQRRLGPTAQNTTHAMAADARLSPREEEVFRHAASGAGNKELADRLSITEATVKVHLTRIFRKLGVSGRAQLAALYHGLRTVGPRDAVAAADRTTSGRRPRRQPRRKIECQVLHVL